MQIFTNDGSSQPTSIPEPPSPEPPSTIFKLVSKLEDIDRQLALIQLRLIRLEEVVHGTYGFPFK